MMVDDVRGAVSALTLTAALALVPVCGVTAQVKKIVSSPAAGTMWLYPERVSVGGGNFVVAERGVLFAPANRNDPQSEILGVEVYRFRADRTATTSTPPIFFLHGGPNFGGLEPSLARAGYYEREIKPYLAVADYVVVGQRGIGSSKPTTTCARPAPVAIDATRDQRAKSVAEAAARCKQFWKEWGLDTNGLTVMQAAADVDDVRKALGYEKIQLWGGSFGSHWAIAMLRYYPQTVARMVLRGLEGPDNTYDSPTGIANALERIAAAADTSAALKGMIPPGGLFKAFKDVIARLDKQPATVTLTDSATGTTTVRVDGDAVRSIAVASPPAWPALVLALHRGDYTAAARAVVRRATSQGIEAASYYVLDCGSGITPERDAAFRADPALAVVGDVNWEYRVTCPVWGNDNGAAFRGYLRTNVPTVMVQGDWDTSTPMENALELRPYFTNSRFVLVKGGSHGSLSQAMAASEEVRRQLIEFFATGDMNGIPEQVVLPPVVWQVR